MNKNNWVMSRAGLINFWYYDEEIFDFTDGKLLLRGSNGSGKSVTMQSLIPLLLDGNKSPERLDPFGSKARKIENYILGEEENGKEESIGYLFLEFKKKETENFLTIGMGFKAVRNKPLKSWGFAITDNRRIGKDFLLYKNIGEKLPLTITELENRIASGGIVSEGQKDYMKMVNDFLFGFSDLDEYDELIKLLIQLRSPKLSREFRPTVIYEILANSLQPLSDDDLRPMTEAIENMDNIKNQLDALKDSKKATDKINSVFDRYNRFVLLQKAKSYLDNLQNVEQNEKDIQKIITEMEQAGAKHESLEAELTNLELELKTFQKKKNELSNHNSVHIKEKMNELKQKIERDHLLLSEKLKQIEMKQDSKREAEKSFDKNVNDKENLLKQLNRLLDEMDLLNKDFSFEEHVFLKEELKHEMDKPYSFQFVEKQFKKHQESIESGLKLLETEERINKEHDSILEELEKSKAVRDEKNKYFELYQVQIIEEKERQIETVYSWRKSNHEFSLTDERLSQISREVQNYESDNGENIYKLLRNEYDGISQNLNMFKNDTNSQLKKINQSLDEKKSELSEWQTKKEPEPQRADFVVNHRKHLAELGIPFVPFYQTIDFQETVDEKQRGLIEEALLDMGILDALVVPKEYREKVLKLQDEGADQFLFASPTVLSHHLGEVIKCTDIANSSVQKQDIEEIIESIFYEEGLSDITVNKNGTYSFGIIKGKTSSLYTSKYIGTAARERYKQDMIEKISADIENIRHEQSQAQEQLDRINQRINTLESEYKQFPSFSDLNAAIAAAKEAKAELNFALKEVNSITVKEEAVYKELKKIREELAAATRKILLSPTVFVYKDALSASKNYRDDLYKLEQSHADLLRTNEIITSLNNQKEDIEVDLDNLMHDKSVIESELNQENMEHEQLITELKLSDYDAIKAELDTCLNRLNEIPAEKEHKIRLSQDEKGKADNKKEELAKKQEQHTDLKLRNDSFAQAFIEELALGLVKEFDNRIDISKQAFKIFKELSFDDKILKTQSEYDRDLYDKYHENKVYLIEYNLKMENLFENDPFPNKKRLNITAKVRGKDVPFYQLCEFINQSIEENEQLMKESDRQLFEDILVKNISKKIRARIYHSDEWVQKMNSLMESMNTSSGLSFSLKWMSNRADDEDQLDTKELVDLLKQDGTLLKEQDLNRLSDHFRSKINKARRELEENGVTQTFHSIIREVLDYRKWFEFKLFFMKAGQNKKELTNNAFFQFSGGEKAMAMYVPLFSAVYARYESARNDCPRIISLDEAFAGVDEQNIRDMFRLLSELNLDYIINSQNLWGDYDTVPALAISELVRPDNADFVTVIRYRWNGKVREMIE